MDYRTRIYDRYNSSRQRSNAPNDRSGLENRLPYLNRFVARHFPDARSALILDIGCGYGAVIDAASRAGYHFVRGVDSSPEQVVSATRLGIDGVELGDAVESLLGYADDSLDVVVAFDVIEHLTMAELIKMTDEVRRVLRVNGRWIIHTTNGASPFFGAVRYGDLTHMGAFTETSLAQLVLSSGFSRVSSDEDEPVAHGWRSVIRLIAWRCIRIVLRFCTAAETGDAGRGILSRNFVTVAIK